MTIDVTRNPSLEFVFLRRWPGTHEVALVRMRPASLPESDLSEPYLACECDFDLEPQMKDGKVVALLQKSDPHKCPAKEAVRRKCVAASSRKFGKKWRALGIKRAILDIYRRVKKGEYLGHRNGVIYVQEVAELLGIPDQRVWDACNALFAEEKLNLNGAILTAYVPRFRFPKEMQRIICYVVEEPLGWPNGDAGDCHLAEVEMRIHETTRWKSGRQAFGADNFPRMDPRIIADHALDFLAAQIDLASEDPTARDRLKALAPDKIVKRLTRLIAKHPKIMPEPFAFFIHECIRLSFQRIEIDAAMRVSPVPPEETLKEMAEFFRASAAHIRNGR